MPCLPDLFCDLCDLGVSAGEEPLRLYAEAAGMAQKVEIGSLPTAV